MFKQKFMAASAATLLLLGAGACSSESEYEPDLNKVKGEPTFAAFTINLPGSEITRADEETTTDPNTVEGVAGEQEIECVHLYIFDGGVLEKHVTPELKPNYNTAVVALTTGEKVVYAITTPAVEKQTETNLSNEGQPITVTEEETRLADFEKQLFDALESNVAQEKAFVMIGRASTVVLKKDEKYAEENPVEINLDRATAKVLVKCNLDDVKKRSTINADFSSPEFAVAQQAKRMYMTLWEGLYTPNGSTNTKGTYDGYLTVGNAKFKNAVTYFEGAKFENFEYTAENKNENPVTGNTTYSMIRLKVSPKAIYSGASLDETTGKVTLTPGTYDGGDFWVVAKNDAFQGTYVFSSDAEYNILYFTDKAAAESYIAAKKLPAESATDYKALCYTNGQAYYRVNLISDKTASSLSDKYCVLRNHYYRIEVTEIKALGAPNPDGTVPENPDEPLEAEGWLAAKIIINPWTVCDMGGTILK